MANPDRPRGFWPIRHLSGGIIRLSEYKIESAKAGNIFRGDLCILDTAGYVGPSTVTSTNLLGVVAGFRWTNTLGEVVFSKYWPDGQTTLGSADAYALVYDDMDIVFGVQTGGTTALTQAMIGANADSLEDHAGSTSTGLSGMELNIASGLGSSTAQCRILGLIDMPNNSLAANAKVEVIINEHLYRSTTGI